MKLRILAKMMLYILAPAVIGLVLLASVASILSQNALRENTTTQLIELAKVQASELNNLLSTLHTVSISTSRLSAAIKLCTLSELDLLKSNEARNSIDVINKYLQTVVDDYPTITISTIVNSKGIIIGHNLPDRIGNDVSSYQSIKDALKGKATIEVRHSRFLNAISANLVSPIMKNGKPIGAVFNLINLETLYKNTAGRINFSETSSTYTIDSLGTIIMADKTELIGLSGTEFPFLQEILAKKQGSIEYIIDDENEFSYFATVPSTGWITIIAAAEWDLMQSITSMTYELFIVAGIILLIVGTIIFMVSRSLVENVKNASAFAAFVAAGNFNLTHEHELNIAEGMKRGDEFSALAASMLTMVKNLSSLFTESKQKTEEAEKAVAEAEVAKETANRAADEASRARQEGLFEAATQLEGIVSIIASASEELATQIEQSSHGAEEQASRIAEAATAMDQMNNTVIEVARNAGTSSELTNNTRIKATEGAEITQKCKEAITNVREDSLVLRSNMSALADHAQSINTVMGVISDIADQTNLLALNAAIEAARAGEAGRGFAVVADEVRKLAEKTIASTTDVANAITAIQQSTELNVQQVDRTVHRIEEATELAHANGEALEGILEMAHLSADGVRAIATASEEQSATSDEISNSINLVNSIANDTSNAMHEASQAVAELANQAAELSTLIENLKRK